LDNSIELMTIASIMYKRSNVEVEGSGRS